MTLLLQFCSVSCAGVQIHVVQEQKTTYVEGLDFLQYPSSVPHQQQLFPSLNVLMILGCAGCAGEGLWPKCWLHSSSSCLQQLSNHISLPTNFLCHYMKEGREGYAAGHQKQVWPQSLTGVIKSILRFLLNSSGNPLGTPPVLRENNGGLQQFCPFIFHLDVSDGVLVCLSVWLYSQAFVRLTVYFGHIPLSCLSLCELKKTKTNKKKTSMKTGR